MNANKLIILSLMIILTSCSKHIEKNKIVIPSNSCKPTEIDFVFDKVTDLSSVIKNLELSSIAFYHQKQEMHSSIECYEKLINELNK